MSKKLLSVLLALVMVLGLIPVTALAAETDQFTDLDPEGWYYDDVKFAVENGYMNGVGDGKFDPTGTLTRAMFVTVLGRYGKAETDATRTSFTDVPIGEWYTGYVTWASDNRIVEGDGTGRFNPEANITNQEMATIIDRFVTWYGNAFNKEHVIKGEAKTFIDQASIPSWAIDHVTQAQIYGLMHGDQNGAFNPLATSQRAQAAALLHRLEWKDKTTVQPDTPDKPDNPTPPAPGGSGIGGGGSKSYTVTFDLNYEGATGTPDSQTLKKNAAVKFPADPTREGHTFKGWTTTKEDKEPYYNSESTDYKVKSDVTFYAQWEVNSYTVTFNANGGSPAPQSQTVKFGGKITEPGEMTLEGHTFGGWFVSENFEGTAVDFSTFTMPAHDVTLYAKWDVNTHKVTFVANGGAPAPDEQTVAYGGKIAEPDDMTLEGHKFGGWFVSENFEGTAVDFNTFTMPDADVTLYAKWEKQSYTVTFDAKGGAPAPDEQTVEFGGKVQKPADMTLEGHSFGGWYDNEAYTGDAVDFDTFTMPAHDVTLYAKWTKNSYEVTFDAKGGAPTPDKQTVPYGDKIKDPGTVTFEGYTFSGWYEKEDYSGTPVNFDEFTMPAHDVTLYAKWTKNSYEVTFDAKGGAPTPDKQTVPYGDKVKDPGIVTFEGYTFSGWYEKEDYSGTPVNFDEFTMPAHDVTLYAKWTKNSYEVTFVANEGTPAPAKQTVEFGGKVAEPDDMTREGYKFEGWFESEDFTGVAVDFETFTMPAHDVTFYAKWVKQSYKVTFEADGGMPAPAEQTVEFEGKVTKPADMTRAGYNFDGWFESEKFEGEAVDFDKFTMPAHDVTLYAKWVKQSYKVTFETNDGMPAPAEQTVEFEGKVTKPADMTREGYNFDGWFESKTFEGQSVDFDKFTMPAHDVTLYAKWVKQSYKVTFEANDGTPAPTEQTVEFGDKIQAPPAMTREGYKFGGWFEKEDCTGNAVDFQTFTMPAHNVTLYAKWAKAYTVTLRNGSEDFEKSDPLEAGESYTIKADPTTSPEASHNGCVFMGWSETENGNPDTDKYGVGKSVTVKDADITLYAVWGHTVTLFDKDTDGNWKAHGDPTKVKHGDTYTVKDDDTTHSPNDGDVFLGWADDTTKDKTAYEDQVKYKANGKKTIENLTSNVSLYAIWAHDYISQAVNDSTEWFNTDVHSKVNSAVEKLKELLNKNMASQPNVDEFDDTFTVGEADYDRATRTVTLSVDAEANGDSVFNLTEFAVRYAMSMFSDGKDADTNIQELKDMIKSILNDVLAELGYSEATVDRDKLEAFVDELAAQYSSGWKKNWLNLNGSSCIGAVKITVGSQAPINVAVPGATMEDVKALAKAVAKELIDEVKCNTTWTRELKAECDITAEFTPADGIKTVYNTDGKSDKLFPTDYTVKISLTGKSDYLSYKYDGKHYVKITVPERVKTAWNNNFPALVDRVMGSEGVQSYLKEKSKQIESDIKSSQEYTQLAAKLKAFGDSVKPNSGFGTTAVMLLDSQISSWMMDNHLKPDSSGKMDVMKSFIVNPRERKPENKALYDFVKSCSMFAKGEIKEKLDGEKGKLPDGALIASIRISPPSADPVEIFFSLPLDHKPKQMFMDAIMGENDFASKKDPAKLIDNILEVLDTFESDLEKIKATYLTAKGAGKPSEQYSALFKLISDTITDSYVKETWDHLRDTGLLKLAVEDGLEAYEAAKKTIEEVRTQINELKPESSDGSGLLNAIMAYIYADVKTLYGCEVDSSVTIPMQNAINAFVDKIIEGKTDDLSPFIGLFDALSNLQHFDSVWEVNVSNFKALLDLVPSDLMTSILTKDRWNTITSIVEKAEGYVNSLPGEVTFKIRSKSFGKTEFTNLLKNVKSAASSESADMLIIAIKAFFGSQLEDVSLSSITESNPIEVTVTYNGHTVNFYLVLEKGWVA